MAAALKMAPVASTVSRPLVYQQYLLNKFDQEEQELRNIEECGTMVPIINHRHRCQVPRFLIPRFHDDGPWEIKKVLTKSDVGSLCRLLLSHDIVETFIFSYWGLTRVNKLRHDDEYSVDVTVRDFDTAKDHKLVFKRWKSNNSYIFQNGWSSKFVKARGLEAGDEIGMFWNSMSGFFAFKLIKKHA